MYVTLEIIDFCAGLISRRPRIKEPFSVWVGQGAAAASSRLDDLWQSYAQLKLSEFFCHGLQGQNLSLNDSLPDDQNRLKNNHSPLFLLPDHWYLVQRLSRGLKNDELSIHA